MAINRTGATGKWIEIASSSPTSGTTVSFTSIPAYKDLAIIAYDINDGGSGVNLSIRLNNDTGNTYGYSILFYSSANSRMQVSNSGKTSSIQLTSTSNGPTSVRLQISGANGPYKDIKGSAYDGQAWELNGRWNSTDIINRLDVIASAAFSAGTIKIFGRD